MKNMETGFVQSISNYLSMFVKCSFLLKIEMDVMRKLNVFMKWINKEETFICYGNNV